MSIIIITVNIIIINNMIIIVIIFIKKCINELHINYFFSSLKITLNSCNRFELKVNGDFVNDLGSFLITLIKTKAYIAN